MWKEAVHESMCDTWSFDRTDVSRPWQGLRHGEPQAVPLSVMEGSQKPYPRRWSQMEAKGLKCRRRTGNGKEVFHRIFSAEAVGASHLSVRGWESEKRRSWRHASRRLPGPCCYRRLFPEAFLLNTILTLSTSFVFICCHLHEASPVLWNFFCCAAIFWPYLCRDTLVSDLYLDGTLLCTNSLARLFLCQSEMIPSGHFAGYTRLQVMTPT